MKKFMTMSAFFLSAACMSVHTPSFATGFIDDISLGVEKATQGLLNTGSHHYKHHRATNDETTRSHSPASYGTRFIDPTAAATPPVIVQDPVSSTAFSAGPDTSSKTQQPSQTIPQEQGIGTATMPKTAIRPPNPSYTTQE